jgi:hypothetical protein
MIELARERLTDALNAQYAARRRIRDRFEARLRRLIERAEAPGRAAEEAAFAQVQRLEKAQLFLDAQTQPLRFEAFGQFAFACVLGHQYQCAVLVVEFKDGRWSASELAGGPEVEGLTREGAIRALCLRIADTLLAAAGAAGTVESVENSPLLALAA